MEHRISSTSLITFTAFILLCTVLFPIGPIQTARAEVTWTGDVDPTNPTTWRLYITTGFIGRTGDGTLNITNGGAIINGTGYIGDSSGSTGVVTVDGADSTWTMGGLGTDLFIGNRGSGVLNIINSGAVTVGDNTWVSRELGSSGAIHFDNGTLTTHGLFTATDDLSGTGTINTRGIVSDIDLVFDATHGWNQTILLNENPGQNITLNLTVLGDESIGAGFNGTGTMTISDGVSVTSRGGYIGYKSGSTGYVTVDGPGSTWTNNNNLNIGYSGSGSLNITSGGAVNNRGSGYIGFRQGAAGVVNVDGAGSTWTNRYDLSIGGYLRSGSLNITNGGVVTVGGLTSVSSFPGFLGSIHFDNGTLMTQGLLTSTEDISGNGTINTHGFVMDIDLVFDTTHGLNQTFQFNNTPDQNITLNLDVDGTALMGAGYDGSGTMTISDGIEVESNIGYIGLNSGSMGIVTVEGTGSTWNSSNLHVGNRGNGTLNITNGGAINSRNSYIGNNSGSTGVVNVDGSSSTWTNSGFLSVGNSGSGTLNITNGGTVTVQADASVSGESDSSGTIHFDNGTLTTNGLFSPADVLSGTGTINTHGLVMDIDLVFDATHGLNQSILLNENSGQNVMINLNGDGFGFGSMGAGFSGNGTMTISDGIEIESTTGYIGYNSGSTGVVTVDGTGSTWIYRSWITVGISGSGTLNITNGGTVTPPSNFDSSNTIGSLSGSTGVVNVDGADSTWNISGIYADSELVIGYQGSGTLNIINGGKVGTFGNYVSYLGDDFGSEGVVTVDGIGSTWKTRAIIVGNHSSGKLNITNGGTVRSGSSHIGGGLDSTGVVTVDGIGSIWTNTGELSIGRSGKGTLNIANGGLVTVGTDVWIDRYSNSEGTLAFGIGPDGAGLLDIEEDLTIGDDSTLLMSFDGGEIPTVGDEFTVITFDGSLTGTFTNEPTPTLAGGYLLDWAVQYNANDITLEVASSVLAGDFNEDGTVDADDFTAWQAGFGTNIDATHTSGDANGDGDIDGSDFLLWQTQFGSSTGVASATSTVVPEPSTLVLLSLFLCLGAIGRFGYRRRSK